MLIFREEFPSTYEYVDIAVREIVNRMKNIDQLNNKTFHFSTSLVLREILNNAVEHGNKFDKDKKIFCEVVMNYPHVLFTIADEGEGIKISEENLLGDDEVLSYRSRGFKIVKKMHFDFKIDESTVIAIFNLDILTNNNEE
jgi:anti-sigma regulatory factor (Ser/Thr protein kinase)